MKRKLILCITLPIIFVGLVLLIMFLATMHKTSVKCIDETGRVFNTYTTTTSIFNKYGKKQKIVGYKFAEWDTSNKEEAKAIYNIDALNMPIIKIDTEGNQEILNKEDYVPSYISIENATEEFNFENISAGVRLRGNSTLVVDKKPYRIKFDKKQNMLGLNSGNMMKSWVLLADWYDFSQSRNFANFYIGSKLNVYCSDYAYVEVFVNGKYNGVYLLCEQQQINKYRINIEEYEEGVTDELDTGYLLENDYFYYQNEDYVIENKIHGNALLYTHWIVKSDTFKPEQLEYIQNYMQQVYDTIFGNSSQAEIEALVDINSAIEMNILQLINNNQDVNSSFYVYKDRGGKLTFTAPWDGDMAYGNVDRYADTQMTGNVNHLLLELMHYDWYMAKLKARWQELKNSNLQEDLINELNAIANSYTKEFKRNFSIYDQLGHKTFDTQVKAAAKFKNQKDASKYLVNWLTKRFEFLNDYLK